MTPTPETIRKILFDAFPPFALLAAMELDLFTALANGPKTAAQLTEQLALGATPRKLEALLLLLVEAKLLETDGERFTNTEEAALFLVRGKPTYMGAAGGMYKPIWRASLETAASLKSGRPAAKLDFAGMSPPECLEYLRGLRPTALAMGRELAGRYDFSGKTTLADVGGGSGALCLPLLQRHPHLRPTVLELPSVAPVTRQLLAELGAAESVEVLATDLFADEPSRRFDVIVLRNFLQILSRAEAAEALRRVSRMLSPGGVVFVCDLVLDESRRTPWQAARFALFFLNAYDAGELYTESEYRQWLTEAGLHFRERVEVSAGQSIIQADKPQGE